MRNHQHMIHSFTCGIALIYKAKAISSHGLGAKFRTV